MCETIVRAIKKLHPDSDITPKQVWEMSPTGELWPIHVMYEKALIILGEK